MSKPADQHPADTAQKQPRGRWKPGQSGNPNGRPRGSRNKTTMAAITLLEGEAEALTRIAIEKALGGDMVALRLCLERIAPPAKGRAVEVDLPAIETPTDVVAAIGAVAKAMAAGDITPEEAHTVAGVIETQRRAVETVALEERIAALEARP